MKELELKVIKSESSKGLYIELGQGVVDFTKAIKAKIYISVGDKKVEASMIKFPKGLYIVPLKERQLRVLKVEEGKTYKFKIEHRR
ncbi:hypothetical protein [Fenollaria sporofastidiosus]|uniref:hypothetical protein n=1 Tax=Fenollaria sporofastidiosus TaxID=2811778 RepID=UPI001C008F9E|nr:hypothetical protein [Fenollaria sporofastidiosus]